MSIGSFGGIVFSVSRKKVNSFSNFKRTLNAEWKEHTRYGQKPLSQFVSLNLENITIDIHLDASLGMKPRQTIEKWEKLLGTGYHDIFVIGGEQIGKYEWKIESISEAWNTILNKGELLEADLSITLSEYLDSDTEVKKASSKKVAVATRVTKTVKNGNIVGSSYKIKTVLTGYYTSEEAKNLTAVNRTGKVYPGTYYIFNLSNGMINVTKVKGSPGSWINPIKNK